MPHGCLSGLACLELYIRGLYLGRFMRNWNLLDEVGP